MCIHCIVLGSLITNRSHTVDITMLNNGEGFFVHIIGPEIPAQLHPFFINRYNEHLEFVVFNGGFKGIVFHAALTASIDKYKPKLSIAGLCITQKKIIVKMARHGKTVEEINRAFGGMSVVYALPDDFLPMSKHGQILIVNKKKV